tara:strand:+ start:3434 stop:4597 length:1164 start_codon:yes stop_codon:yes gene_type:complete
MAKSDANLIKGAYAAAGGGIKDFGLAGSKAATSISKTLMEPVIKEVQGRSNEFEEYVDWELSRDTDMNEATYKAKTEELQGLRSRYILGDNTTRAEIMREMNQYKAEQEKLNNASKKFAKSSKNKSTGVGASKEWTFSKEAIEIGKQIKNGIPVMHNGKLTLPITINGEKYFYSAEDLDNLRNQLQFDLGSRKVLLAMANKATQQGAAAYSPDGKYKQFDFDSYYNIVKSELTDRGSLHSLANHQLGTNKFSDDLISYLGGKTYSDLGVQTPMSSGKVPTRVLKNLDPTKSDDMITPKDAKVIVKALLKDESTARNYITNYYTSYLMNQYNSQLPERTSVQSQLDQRGDIIYYNSTGEEVDANDPSAILKRSSDGTTELLKNTDYAD